MFIIARCLDKKYVDFEAMNSNLRNTYILKDYYKKIRSAFTDIDLFIYTL